MSTVHEAFAKGKPQKNSYYYTRRYNWITWNPPKSRTIVYYSITHNYTYRYMYVYTYIFIFIFIYMYKHTTRTHIQILPLSSSLSKSTNNRTPPFTTIQTTKKRTPKHKIHPFSNGFFCQVAIPASNWKHLHRNHSRHDPHHAPPCGSPPGAAYRERAWSLPHKWGQKQRRSFFGGDMFS